ncbi:MAG TPA: hypothetical protein VMW58_01485 [Anaerolineae bacterium]|nr:hypothetical protein [Anaerolineae bacterium]
MPAPATEQTPASRQDLIEAAAASAQEDVEVSEPEAEPKKAVLDSNDVAGTPSERAQKRESVAPKLREFIKAQQAPPEPSALEKEIGDLREALDGLAAPATKQAQSVEQQMLAKLEALENRFATQEARDAEAREEEEYNNRVRTMREGVIENINARKEDFPALVALEQQETVFNALVQRSQEGVETSEEEIASEVEAGLRTVYETLQKVFGSTAPSEDQPNSERKVTLTPGLSGTDEAADLDTMSRSDRIEYLWAKSQQS